MPTTLEKLRSIGPKSNVIQIVPPKQAVRPAILRAAEMEDHELVTRPLASPTGPGGAAGFHNRAGSTIANPEVTNVYLGAFWGDRAFVEGFSRAVVENGYLDPLRELHYGTGSGKYLGASTVPRSRPAPPSPTPRPAPCSRKCSTPAPCTAT